MNLGETVKDRISGFTGIVVARTEYLYKQSEVVVQPQKLSGEVPAAAQTFSESQVEGIEPEIKQKAGLV